MDNHWRPSQDSCQVYQAQNPRKTEDVLFQGSNICYVLRYITQEAMNVSGVKHDGAEITKGVIEF